MPLSSHSLWLSLSVLQELLYSLTSLPPPCHLPKPMPSPFRWFLAGLSAPRLVHFQPGFHLTARVIFLKCDFGQVSLMVKDPRCFQVPYAPPRPHPARALIPSVPHTCPSLRHHSPLTSRTRHMQSLCTLFPPYSYTRMTSVHPPVLVESSLTTLLGLLTSHTHLFPLGLFLPIFASLRILLICLPYRSISSVCLTFVSQGLSTVPNTSRCWLSELIYMYNSSGQRCEERVLLPLWVRQWFVNQRCSTKPSWAISSRGYELFVETSKVRHIERKRELTDRKKGAPIQDREQRWLVQQRILSLRAERQSWNLTTHCVTLVQYLTQRLLRSQRPAFSSCCDIFYLLVGLSHFHLIAENVYPFPCPSWFLPPQPHATTFLHIWLFKKIPYTNDTT